jgi:hypothetical protein
LIVARGEILPDDEEERKDEEDLPREAGCVVTIS